MIILHSVQTYGNLCTAGIVAQNQKLQLQNETKTS